MINKEEVKNILISRTDRLGDVILTLPLVTSVKNYFKDSKVYFLGKKYVEDLIHDYKGIDEFVAMDSSDSFTKKLNIIKEKKIDLVISVKPEFDLALLFYLSGIKYRIGTGYRWYSFLYNNKVYEHRKVSDKHESEYNLNLIRTFFPAAGSEKEFYFSYSEDDKKRLNNKISNDKFNPDKKYIVIHPGSSGSAKDLSFKKFTEIINMILEKFPFQNIVFTGLNNERELIMNITEGIDVNFKNRTFDLSGKLDLRELLILIDNSDLFISNSTGPIHIAGALNKNVIGFYPNEEAMSSRRWKPLGKNIVIISPAKGNNMESIQSESVMESVEKFL